MLHVIPMRIKQPIEPDDILLDPEFDYTYIDDDEIDPVWDSSNRDYPDYLEA